jgi:diguanylate cyclase (GGDEF)-like protein
MTSRFDGVERIVSSRRLADYPLIVLVGFDTGAVFRSYTAHLHRSEITAGIATLVVLLLGGFWIRQRLRSVASNAALEVTLEAINQGIVMVDGRGNVPVVNSRAVELLDLPPGTRRMAASGDLRLPGGAMPDSGTVTEMSGPDGRIIEVHASATPSGGSVMSYTDVTGRRADEARIMHLALHDGLTGLANRTLLHERIAGAVADAETTQGQFAVISMDIDSFGDVNDSLGHGMGDLLLTSVAARLRALVRPCDTVARVGGDEFAIVAVCADAGAALQIARRVTESLAAPVDLAGHAWLLSAGAGVAMFPADGLGTEDLLRSADMALCRAKSDGRGTVRRYEAWMAQSVQDRLLLERDLRLALERGELEVYMQPQFSCETMRVTGFEALARWRHPVRGMVPPGVFIPVAEECGLIVAVGRLMLERACELAAAWRPKCSVAVNLSPIQFRDAGLPDLLAGILRRTGLDAGLLELEVTEGVLINDAEQALGSLRALKALGVRLALDDFGTGYSSLSYLRRFPFDRIKIDKTFVQAQEHDDGTRAILEAVLAMSSRLNIAVIAEGVETEDQLQMLRGQGCGEVQGFLLARPMPSADVQAFLSAADGGALSRRVSPSVIPVSARGMAAAPTLVPARAA